MVLVINMIQVMKIKLMSIHLAKVKKVFILECYTVLYSKSSTKNRYTEFILEDLNQKLYHYWALGHIHERQELSDMPPIYYPGNIQGRHFGSKDLRDVYW